jgi:hypothetical protein
LALKEKLPKISLANYWPEYLWAMQRTPRESPLRSGAGGGHLRACAQSLALAIAPAGERDLLDKITEIFADRRTTGPRPPLRPCDPPA